MTVRPSFTIPTQPRRQLRTDGEGSSPETAVKPRLFDGIKREIAGPVTPQEDGRATATLVLDDDVESAGGPDDDDYIA